MSFQKTSLYPPIPNTNRGSATVLSSSNTHLFYANGRIIYMRDLKNPEIASEYTGHTCQTTVARPSPSGYYVASADVQGNVRIWDLTQQEHILKSETKVFSGRVNDLAWDFESKRLIAVGEGKERFGHAFLFDTLSSVGEIMGHSKAINSISMRPGRPLRAVTGSDDASVNFYHGVPFKFNQSIHTHSRFVQCVRYSPLSSVDLFASSGSDAKIFLYDGKSGESVSELTQGAHTGSVFSISWSPDGKQLLSSSADMTCKLWDVETRTAIRTFTFSDAPNVDEQQVGCIWQGDHLVSLSLNGYLTWLDPQSGNLARQIKGHQKGITSLDMLSDKTLVSGSYDGRIMFWDKESGHAELRPGFQHSNQITSFSVQSDNLYSAGMDDLIRNLSLKESNVSTVNANGIPKNVTSFSDYLAFITSTGELSIRKGSQSLVNLKLDYSPCSLSFSRDGNELAVGGTDGSIRFYTWNGLQLTLSVTSDKNRGEVTCISYSPDGKMVAASDTQRAVLVYDTTTKQIIIHQWVFHTARVNSVSWSPDSLHAASGGLDTNLEIWSVQFPMKHISIKCAHSDAINGVIFIDNTTVVSAGQDGTIKKWSLSHFE